MIPEYQRGVSLVGYDLAYEVQQRRRAVLTVCRLARDAEDAGHVLEVLGLRPHEGRPNEDDRCS